MDLFIDSNILIGYVNKKDTHHQKSKEIFEDIDAGKYEEIFISDYVFSEFMTVTQIKIKDKKNTVNFGEKILNSQITLFKIGYDTFVETWEDFKNSDNNKMSFVDHSNVVVMKQLGIKNIATFDSDFKDVKGIKVVDGGLK